MINQNDLAIVRGKKIIAFGTVKVSAKSSGTSSVALFDDNTFSVFDAATLTSAGVFRVNGNATGSFAIADVNGDGQEDILIGTDNGLYAYNWNGAQIDNFPLKILDGGKVAGSPIIAGLVGSSTRRNYLWKLQRANIRLRRKWKNA